MGELDDVRAREHEDDGLCITCRNLVVLTKKLIGCEAHDRLVMPQYPPYGTRGFRCPEWKVREE
jgi:hypothetical protein